MVSSEGELWGAGDYTEVRGARWRVELSPLPCWEDLGDEEVQRQVEEILQQIIDETAERHHAEETQPLGRRQILRQRPHAWPRVHRSPAPRFHAASFEIRRMLGAMYRAFLDLRADALEALRQGRLPARFPAHGIPPPFVLALGTTRSA